MRKCNTCWPTWPRARQARRRSDAEGAAAVGGGARAAEPAGRAHSDPPAAQDRRGTGRTCAQQPDPAVLTAAVRTALGRFIVQEIAGMSAELPVFTLNPQLERVLQESTQGNGAALEPGLAERLHQSPPNVSASRKPATSPRSCWYLARCAPRWHAWSATAFRRCRSGLQRGAGGQAPEAGRNDQLTPPADAPENRHHLRTNATDRYQGEPAPCRPPTTRVPRPPLRRLRLVTTA